jgi:hypothetical protein
MSGAVLTIDTPTGSRAVRLNDYLGGAGEEDAQSASITWIKQLRQLSVDGQPMRQRFTYRGESLWWFTELYLHKEGVILELLRMTGALDRLLEQEHPAALRVAPGHRLLAGVASQMAAARGVGYRGPTGFGGSRLWRLELRARALAYAAFASRFRPRSRVTRGATEVVAFVHRAFWHGEGSAESYIGPVLADVERRLAPGALKYVAVGPAANFRARRWWHPLTSGAPSGAVPIEALVPPGAMRHSARLWRERHALRRALWSADQLRQHAIVDGIDWWPIVREQLAGVALLQWPWSARTMDEAGAALDALEPRVALTYAEAGGWGRALMIECRRRGIASVGLQHGFIYRHWLNYLHEADEQQPWHAPNARDRGFPRPDLTLVFDGYAAAHLESAGRFPREALEITGSPRLDALVDNARRLTPDAIGEARRSAGADDTRRLVLVATKYREARGILPALVAAAASLPGVQLAIKTHPAETPDAYAALAAGHPHVRVLPASAPLAPLIAAASAIVTVNSTVALDAAVLGVPTLVVGLPNNLSPLVDLGAMAGAEESEIGQALGRILYDQQFRQQLDRARGAFLARYAIGSDGTAARGSADAVLRLVEKASAGDRPAN